MAREEEPFDDMSLEEKLILLHKIYVIYPKLKKLLDLIDYCRTHSKIATEPIGLLITGPRGQGKTTLCKRYTKQLPRRIESGKLIVPVLSVGVPVPATIKNLASNILEAFGDPAADKGTIANMTMRIWRYTKFCETELFIFDEFQHFIDRDSLKVLHAVSDWLKMLMNDLGKPIVLMGMPKSESILNEAENEQLGRRFPLREELVLFSWNRRPQREEFRKFLKMIEEKLPLKEKSNLSDVEIAGRIFEATKGVIDDIMKLIRRATELALKKGFERVDHELLNKAFDDFLSKKTPLRDNPFKTKKH